MTDRVVAYIDGFNLYFGLKADRGRRHLWPEKRIVAVFPPRRNSAGLIAAVDAYIRIGSDKIRNAQLPAEIVTANGITLERPEHWS